MGFKCSLGMHDWDGCKCSSCGKIRDKGHDWDGCKCVSCGKTRDEKHDWSKNDCSKCSKCGKMEMTRRIMDNGCNCARCVEQWADVRRRDSINQVLKAWIKAERAIMAETEVTALMFAEHATTGPARCRVSINEIPGVVNDLNTRLQKLGIKPDELRDLHYNTLLSVCPKCNEYCAGPALLMMDMMKNANTMFTGNSGGFERMLEGLCFNYSCSSTEHELFWAPDLNPSVLKELHSRGIKIDPNIQRSRNHIWKPKR